MRRLLAWVLLLLLPLQPALAVALPAHVAGLADCHTSEAGHAPSELVASACHCAGGGLAGHHGGATAHHPCPHLGAAFLALRCSEIVVIDAPKVAPVTAPARFDSIVLGVPSPPPIPFA